MTRATPKYVRAVAAWRASVTRQAELRDVAAVEVAAAHAAGEKVPDIMANLGVSRARVYQMIELAEEKAR